jgi:hypothetical protein
VKVCSLKELQFPVDELKATGTKAALDFGSDAPGLFSEL